MHEERGTYVWANVFRGLGRSVALLAALAGLATCADDSDALDTYCDEYRRILREKGGCSQSEIDHCTPPGAGDEAPRICRVRLAEAELCALQQGTCENGVYTPMDTDELIAGPCAKEYDGFDHCHDWLIGRTAVGTDPLLSSVALHRCMA